MILIVGGTFQGKKAFAEKLLNEQLQLLAQKSKECRLEDLADITLAMVRVFETLVYHA